MVTASPFDADKLCIISSASFIVLGLFFYDGSFVGTSVVDFWFTSTFRPLLDFY